MSIFKSKQERLQAKLDKLNKQKEELNKTVMIDIHPPEPVIEKKRKTPKVENIDDDVMKLKKNIIKSDEFEDGLNNLPENSKSFNRINKSGIINKFKDKKWPEKTYIINMELRNGMHKSFIINTDKNFFKFMKGTYVIDTECQYFETSSRTYCLDYHQDLPLPIMRKIPVREIQRTMNELAKIDPEQLVTSMNPQSLEAFIEGKVVEQLMKAQSIDEFFKRESMKSWIVLAITSITLIIIVKASGMLNNIKIPGLG